jgi:D-xylose reductase
LTLAGFELSGDDVAAISALNKNRRFNDPGDFCADAFNTFHAIYD